MYAVQFHPEVEHSQYGKELLRNFIYDVCGCQGLWTMENFIEEQIKAIRERVGDKNGALCSERRCGFICSLNPGAPRHR